jgi:arginyl-tRNA synthetase
VISNFLEERLTIAARQVLGEDVLIKVTPCNEEVFGDYQSTSIIQAAKARKLNPRKLAEDILARANFSDFCESVNIAGAGFINFVLRPEAVVKFLKELVSSKFVFEKARDRRTVIIDFSSPNVAKPMHVGHIRSTIIGDCLARVFRFLGHNVITDNHLGDWGTQFGKLIVGWKKFLDEKNLQADPIGEMERLYKLVNGACEHDENLLNEARAELVKLQSGDEENLGLWKRMLSLSLNEFEKTYQRLGVKFDYILGESFYNNELK